MRFISGFEAALLKDTLIICDLHLGMERQLFHRGIRIGSLNDFLIEKTLALLSKTKARRLVILGDIKENVVAVESEVRRYFESVSPHAEITVCKGNHDGNLERISSIETIGPEGFVLHSTGLFHGHAWPAPGLMQCETVLMGHNHPQFTFFESGKKEPHPVWMFCPPGNKKIRKRYPQSNGGIRLVVMPSFNPLLGNDISSMGGLGPLFRNKLFKWEGAIVYTLHGIRLGTVDEVVRR